MDTEPQPPPSFTQTYTNTEASLVRGRLSAILYLTLGARFCLTTHTLTGKWHVNFALGQCLNAKIPVATDVMRRETFTELHYHWTAVALPGHTLSHTPTHTELMLLKFAVNFHLYCLATDCYLHTVIFHQWEYCDGAWKLSFKFSLKAGINH